MFDRNWILTKISKKSKIIPLHDYFPFIGYSILADDSNVNTYFDYVLKKVFQSSHSIFWAFFNKLILLLLDISTCYNLTYLMYIYIYMHTYIDR